jgi:hypothetical protein
VFETGVLNLPSVGPAAVLGPAADPASVAGWTAAAEADGDRIPGAVAEPGATPPLELVSDGLALEPLPAGVGLGWEPGLSWVAREFEPG